MCSIDFDGTLEVFRDAVRKARKPHTCDGCRTVVKPGEYYMNYFIVFDGDPSSEDACFRCWTVMYFFGEEHGVQFGPRSLTNVLLDCVDSQDPDSRRWKVALRWIEIRWARARKAKEAICSN